VSPRRARGRRRLLRSVAVYHYNGLWPEKVLLRPFLTARDLLRFAAVLAVAAPLALLLGGGLLSLALIAYPPLLLAVVSR